MKRPSTAPAYKSSIDRSHHSLHRQSSSHIINKDYRRSHSVVHSTHKQSSARNVYRNTADIRDFTQQLLHDILPNKFKPLQSEPQSEAFQNIDDNLLKLSSPPLSTRSKKMDNLSSVPLTSRSHICLNRRNNSMASISTKRSPKYGGKNIMTPYEKYTFMDQVHGMSNIYITYYYN